MREINLNTKGFTLLNMGQSPESVYYNIKKVGLPFYQGKKDFGILHPTPSLWCHKPKKIANKNDILLTVRAPVGSTNIANEKCCIGRGIAAISCKNNLIRDYIYITLKAFEIQIENEGLGSGVKAITKPKLEKLLFKIPNKLNETKKIINYFKKKIEILELTQNKILALENDTNKFLSSALKDIFKKNIKLKEYKMSEVIKITSGDFLPSHVIKKDGKYPVYGGGTNTKLFSDYFNFNKKTITIGRVGATAGNINITKNKSWITDNALYVKKKLIPLDDEFLFILLKSLNLPGLLQQNAQPFINGEIVYKNIAEVPIKISDQKLIAKKMIKLNDNLDKMNKKIIFLKKEINNFKLSTFKKLIKNNIRFNDEE